MDLETDALIHKVRSEGQLDVWSRRYCWNVVSDSVNSYPYYVLSLRTQLYVGKEFYFSLCIHRVKSSMINLPHIAETGLEQID